MFAADSRLQRAVRTCRQTRTRGASQQGATTGSDGGQVGLRALIEAPRVVRACARAPSTHPHSEHGNQSQPSESQRSPKPTRARALRCAGPNSAPPRCQLPPATANCDSCCPTLLATARLPYRIAAQRGCFFLVQTGKNGDNASEPGPAARPGGGDEPRPAHLLRGPQGELVGVDAASQQDLRR